MAFRFVRNFLFVLEYNSHIECTWMYWPQNCVHTQSTLIRLGISKMLKIQTEHTIFDLIWFDFILFFLSVSIETLIEFICEWNFSFQKSIEIFLSFFFAFSLRVKRKQNTNLKHQVDTNKWITLTYNSTEKNPSYNTFVT